MRGLLIFWLRVAVVVVTPALLFPAGLSADENGTPPRLMAPPDALGQYVGSAFPPITHCFELKTDRRGWFTAPERVYRYGQFDWVAGHSIVVSRRRVPVIGGLVPSPNLAAQAGTLDPNLAAMAFNGDRLHQAGLYTATNIRPPRLPPCARK
jgi:hypothetical protein